MLRPVDRKSPPDLVKYLQKCLTRRGFPCGKTGRLDRATELSLALFCSSAGVLYESGCSTATWEALHRKSGYDAPTLILGQTQKWLMAQARKLLRSEGASLLGPKATRVKAVEVAAGYLGYCEQPPGSNSGEYIEALLGGLNGGSMLDSERGGDAPPWAPAALHAMLLEAIGRGRKLLPRKESPLVDEADWLRSVTLLAGVAGDPWVMGSVVSLSGHMGIVAGETPDGLGLVIEPNADGRVCLRTRWPLEVDYVFAWWADSEEK